MTPKKGNIYLADIPFNGNQQAGIRPVIVTQNNKGCYYAPCVHVVPLSTRVDKAKHLPTHVLIQPSEQNGLSKPSVALTENLVSIQKENLIREFGEIEPMYYNQVAEAIKIHLAI